MHSDSLITSVNLLLQACSPLNAVVLQQATGVKAKMLLSPSDTGWCQAEKSSVFRNIVTKPQCLSWCLYKQCTREHSLVKVLVSSGECSMNTSFKHVMVLGKSNQVKHRAILEYPRHCTHTELLQWHQAIHSISYMHHVYMYLPVYQCPWSMYAWHCSQDLCILTGRQHLQYRLGAIISNTNLCR